MKKLFILGVWLLLGCSVLLAQTSKYFNYQAVIRDNTGELITNKNLTLRIAIIDDIAQGEELYVESHSVTSNNYGLVNLKVGSGEPNLGSYNTINWSDNDKYIKTEIDLGDGYKELGTVQLNSVPYALYSNNSDSSRVTSLSHQSYFADSASVAAFAHTSSTAEFANSANLANTLSQGVYSTNTDTLFVVKDHDGNVVFAVFPDGAQVIVNEATKGKVGGFAISGRSPNKAGDWDIVRITADSTRIYVNDTVSAKGKVGGFAISGRSPNKSLNNNLLYVTADSTRVYVNENTGTKGKVGGFAVSGRSPNKGVGRHMFVTTVDSTRVFTQDTVGGFAVQDSRNGGSSSYMKLTPLNYFIGHESGELVKQNPTYPDRGKYNTFFGYNAGKSNTYGYNNIFMGYRAGYSNDDGNDNIFLGISAGFSNVNSSDNIFIGNYAGYNTEADDPTFGSENVFIGSNAGYSNLEGYDNVYIGAKSGEDNLNGRGNVFIGGFAGNSNLSRDNTIVGGAALYKNTNGKNNTIVGAYAGNNNITGEGNIFIGYQAGYNEAGSDKLYIANSSTTTPLIYGDFSSGSEYIQINGNVNVNGTYLHLSVNPGSGASPTNYSYQGLANSTGKEFAFSIYDALWVTSNVYLTGVYNDAISGTYRDLYIKDDGQIGYVSSSKRYKKDINDIVDVSWLYNLRPVNFVYKADDTNTKEYGLIAEEVEQVNKLLVSYNDKGVVETVNYSKLITPILKAVQEQKEIISNQQYQIDDLKSKNEELKQKLNEIIKMLEEK
ncbi:MAG: tail fiber domain-containing protein [Bacteroidetes bacterium]|nr:tail fiber domain-containing protein [Bacteroidota bacterium]